MSLLAALAASALLAAPAAAGRPADHVFIVMLDGTRPDFLRRARAPVIHALTAAGTTFLQAETTYPSQTRVAFVSLPTGSYPGSHGIVGGDEVKDASWKDLETGNNDPIAAQALVARPTFFEEATAAGLTSIYAAMKGYELVGAKGATWTINGKQTLDKTAYAARYDPESGASADLALWYKQRLSRDLLDQTLALVREHKPNLVVINLGSPDYVAHTWGPLAPQYVHTIEFIDGLVGELKAELGRLGILERTAFVFSADHGFSDVDPTRVIAPAGDASRQAGPDDRRHTLDPLAARGIEHFVTNTGGASMGVYIRDKARIAEAVALLRREPWVESIYCEPTPARCDLSLSSLHSYFPGRSPDLMVDLDDDATLNFPQPGQHGTHRPSDMRIPLVFSGAGVARGVVGGKASIVDVAPTVLRLLGLTGTVLHPDGHVLEDALAH
ncbi:MAG TPA: alkaline phosphatase family protein [Vicinamibacteria bacterium]